MPIHDWTRVDEGIFHAFHVNWTVELAKALNRGILPADYYALPEQVAGETRPDVLTLHECPGSNARAADAGNGGEVATLAPLGASQVMTITTPDYSRLSRLITIRHVPRSPRAGARCSRGPRSAISTSGPNDVRAVH